PTSRKVPGHPPPESPRRRYSTFHVAKPSRVSASDTGTIRPRSYCESQKPPCTTITTGDTPPPAGRRSSPYCCASPPKPMRPNGHPPRAGGARRVAVLLGIAAVGEGLDGEGPLDRSLRAPACRRARGHRARRGSSDRSAQQRPSGQHYDRP